MAERPIICKCPNYLECLTGYRGEDIEVFPGMAAVCPECDTPLQPVKKQTPAYVAQFINLAIISTIAALAWLAWPKLSALWTRPAAVPVEKK